MRSDNAAFIAKNVSNTKEPYYTVEISFTSDNSVVRYFTSHTDAQIPVGGTKITNTVDNISGTTQRILPEKALGIIGSITIKLVNLNNTVRDVLYQQDALGRTLTDKRVRIYVGFKGMVWDDYSLIQTQIIETVNSDENVYIIRCSDIQRSERKQIFDLKETTLTQSVSAEVSTYLPVNSITGFELVAHGSSYSVHANTSITYVKIEDEIVAISSFTTTHPQYGNAFEITQRGALNTKAAFHNVDVNADADRRTKVEEYVYLEMPAPKLAYAILTGKLYAQGSAVLPSNWHLDIGTAFVRQSDFITIGLDWWNPTDDTQGFNVRFTGLKKQDAKKFLEREIMYLMGAFMPVYADGALGFKRMTGVLTNSSYVRTIDQFNTISHSDLEHDIKGVQNNIEIQWNWNDRKNGYTRRNVLLDSESIARHGLSIPLVISFRGLHGSIHTVELLQNRFDALRDRFSGPPLRLSVECFSYLNILEVGDIVRVVLSSIDDYKNDSTIDRAFEVQQVRIDWIKGTVRLELFGSSEGATEVAPSQTGNILPDSYYTSEGTELVAYLSANYAGESTITGGVLHITGSVTLPGDDIMTNASAIYYYDNDMTIDANATVRYTDNMQLRIKGFYTINGGMEGKGAGYAGAANNFYNQTIFGEPDYTGVYNEGTIGFLGTPISGGGIVINNYTDRVSYEGHPTFGLNGSMPPILLNYVSSTSTLNGIPDDLRGSSGSSGAVTRLGLVKHNAGGGAGGSSGAGLFIISRGAGFGINGKINTSGSSGSTGEYISFPPLFLPSASDYAGSGAGGAPGAVIFAIDGGLETTPDVNNVIACYGTTPTIGNILTSPSHSIFSGEAEFYPYYSYYIGTQCGTHDLSGILAARIAYIMGEASAISDITDLVITPPSSLSIQSGTNQLIREVDGTIIVRALISWMKSNDQRIVGYEVQFKRSIDAVWITGPTVIGSNITSTYIFGVKSGINYDFRVRSATGFNEQSVWVETTGITIIGKTEPPPDCDTFTVTRQADGTRIFDGGLLPANIPTDFAGYKIRAALGSSLVWDDLINLHEGSITALPWETNQLPAGHYTAGIKAIDTTGNKSTNALIVESDLGDPRIKNAVYTADERSKGWPGTKINLWKNRLNNLIIRDTKTWDDLNTDGITWDDWHTWARAAYTSATYETSAIDIGVTVAFTPLITFVVENGTGDVQEAHSSDGISYTSWATVGAQITSRYFKIRGNYSSVSATTSNIGKITQLSIILDSDLSTEILDDIDTSAYISAGGSAGDLRLPINNSYTIIRHVGIALQSVGAGWSWEIVDKNPILGPRIRIYNANASLANALIDAEIKGL